MSAPVEYSPPSAGRKCTPLTLVVRGGAEPGLVDGDRGGEEGVLDVERWAELRREHFVGGASIKGLARRHGIDRNTVRQALRSDAPPVYRRLSASKLDPFKDDIHRLLKTDPKLPGQRVRELIAPLGFDGGKTIVDDYLREVRPLFAAPARTFQRTARARQRLPGCRSTPHVRGQCHRVRRGRAHSGPRPLGRAHGRRQPRCSWRR